MQEASGHISWIGKVHVEPGHHVAEPAWGPTRGPGSSPPAPFQELIEEAKREVQDLKKEAQELRRYGTVVADSHRMLRQQQLHLIAENVFLQELRTRLRPHAPGPSREPAAQDAGGSGGPSPGVNSDLDVLRLAVRGLLDSRPTRPDPRGLPPDVALALAVQSLARSTGEHAQASWLPPLLNAMCAQEAAASQEPEHWEECD